MTLMNENEAPAIAPEGEREQPKPADAPSVIVSPRRQGEGFRGPRGDRREGGSREGGDKRRGRRDRPERKRSEYEERVVKIQRISKTTKGGRTLRFSALVVVGNRRGKVGFATAKALEVPNAIRKALRAAENGVRDVAINKSGTLYHEVIGASGAAKVLLKPAPSGTGIIAGGPIRAVIELAGYTDIYTKNLGNNTPVNMIAATMDGILQQLTPKRIAKLRGKQLSEL